MLYYSMGYGVVYKVKHYNATYPTLLKEGMSRMEKTENIKTYETNSLYQASIPAKSKEVILKEYQKFCEQVWEFLRDKEYPPIKVIDAHHRYIIAGGMSARCVLAALRCRTSGGISRDVLEDTVRYFNDILQDDEETVDYKIKYLLDMGKYPYLEVDPKSEQLRCTPRAVQEEEYIERIAGEEIRETVEKQLEIFEIALNSLSRLGKGKYIPALRELAGWLLVQFPEHTLFEALRILDAYSVTDIKTCVLLSQIPRSGITKYDLTTKANKVIWGPRQLDEWLDVKIMGVERLGMIRKDGERYFLTDYGLQALCVLMGKTEKELGLDPNSSTAIVASGQQALESTFSDVSDLVQRIEAINSPDDLYRLESAIQKKRTELELMEAEPPMETSSDREHPGPDTSTGRLVQIFDAFASLSREDKEKFLNVVAWAKPVELMQERSTAAEELPGENRKSFVERLNGGAEPQLAMAEFPKNASALEIMQRAHTAISDSVKLITKDNIYDLVRCSILKNRIGDSIDNQLRELLGVKPGQKMVVKPSVSLSTKTGKNTEAAYVEIEGSGLPKRKEKLSPQARM